jgi:hypothetical protein
VTLRKKARNHPTTIGSLNHDLCRVIVIRKEGVTVVIITVVVVERGTMYFHNSLGGRRLLQRELRIRVDAKTVSRHIRYHAIHITLRRIARMDMRLFINVIGRGNTIALVPGTPLAVVKNARHRSTRTDTSLITVAHVTMHSHFQATRTRITLRPACHLVK